MKIERVEKLKDRKKFIDLLLIGDEEIDLLNKYLGQGQLYTIYDNGLKGAMLIVKKGGDTIEIKNISIFEDAQRRGYGKRLIEHIFKKYKGQYRRVIVGTGNSPLTIPFYKALGFRQYFVVKDFFIKNYREEIIEGGVKLRDMIYLEKFL